MPDATSGFFTTTDQGISDKLISDLVVASSSNPKGALSNIKALWDTGAMCSVISEDLAMRLGLSAVSVQKIATPTNVMDAKMYMVDFILPNSIEVKHINVLGAYPSSVDVLIGMDIIGLGDFAVTNYLKQTCFTFRIPSKERIDFSKT